VVGGAILLDLPDREVRKLSPVCRAMLGECVGRNRAEAYSRRFAPGSNNLLVEANVFAQVGQFDESLIYGGEDMDLARRIRLAGIEAWFTPSAVVRHFVPEYRLEERYLFWVSLRWGNLIAYRDHREWGLLGVECMCLAKALQASLITVPLLAFAILMNKRSEIVAHRSLILRVVGYARQSLFLLSPSIFAQRRYFARLTFRNERSSFASSTN